MEEPQPMILAGDIGGTSTRLAYFDVVNGRLSVLAEHIYRSHEYRSLEAAVAEFIAEQKKKVQVACFGIAGPVHNRTVSTPNLPWKIDATALERELGIARVFLLNDLEASAYGLAELEAKDYAVLSPGSGGPVGNRVVIAAGTGLGEAGLYWDGKSHHPFASEGGHVDFAPVNDLQIELLQFLRKKFSGRVSVERVLSGPGLFNIYEFLRDSGKAKEEPWLKEQLQQAKDPSAVISQNGMSGKSPLCDQVLKVFTEIYGSEAGNLALKMMATGGVYIGGGIAPKILQRLQRPEFMHEFTDKGRLSPLLKQTPVRVVLNDKVGLLGAAHVAVSHSQTRMEVLA
ncbi:MAG TPA: glucokinase [Terriglobales bacterium]